jgi:hypothetical protein
MIFFVVVYWTLFCMRSKLKILSPRVCYGHLWMNSWCKQGCINLISMGLWLMLQVWITMQSIIFMVVIPMFPKKVRNIDVSTTRKKVWGFTQKVDTSCILDDHIDVCKQWVKSPTRKDFVMNRVKIEVWWNELWATIPKSILQLQ